MAYYNPAEDGKIDIISVDFNLLERQLCKAGEFGCVHVNDVLRILKKKIILPDRPKRNRKEGESSGMWQDTNGNKIPIGRINER